MTPKILVVDDEIEILNVVKEFLTKKGFKILTAENAKKALNLIKKDKDISLVILDRKMPGEDGVVVLKTVKKKNAKKVPVILLTGSVEINHYADYLKNEGLEPEEILPKPLDLYTLLDIIKKRLPKK